MDALNRRYGRQAVSVFSSAAPQSWATAVHIRKKVVVSPAGIDDPMMINASILADLSLLKALEQGIMGTPSGGMNVAFADFDICCHCEERSDGQSQLRCNIQNLIRFLYLIIR